MAKKRRKKRKERSRAEAQQAMAQASTSQQPQEYMTFSDSESQPIGPSDEAMNTPIGYAESEWGDLKMFLGGNDTFYPLYGPGGQQGIPVPPPGNYKETQWIEAPDVGMWELTPGGERKMHLYYGPKAKTPIDMNFLIEKYKKERNKKAGVKRQRGQTRN